MRYHQVRSQCAANILSISISKNTARHKSNTIQHIHPLQSTFLSDPLLCWARDGGGGEMLFLRRDPDHLAEHVEPMMLEDKCDNGCVLVNLLLEVRIVLGNLTSAVVAHSQGLRIVN